jgi:hypothetical protein
MLLLLPAAPVLLLLLWTSSSSAPSSCRSCGVATADRGSTFTRLPVEQHQHDTTQLMEAPAVAHVLASTQEAFQLVQSEIRAGLIRTKTM